MSIIKKVLKFFIDNFGPVIRFGFFGLIGMFLSFLIFGLVGFLGFSLAKFSYGNIDFFTNLGPYLNLSLALGIVGLSIIAFSSFCFGLGKKGLNKYFIFTSLITLVFSLLFFTMFGVEVSKKLSNYEVIKSDYNVNLSGTGGDLLLNFKLNDNQNGLNLLNISDVEVLLGTGNVLKVEFEDKIHGDKEIISQIQKNISKLESKINGNEITFKYEKDKEFANLIPFSFINRKVFLYVPKNYTIKINSNNYFEINGVELSKKFKKYSNYSENGCYNSKIYFDENDKKFYCENSLNLKSARESYIENYLIKNFDAWSKITHKSKYKREYYDDGFEDFDWKVESVNWIDNDNLELTISDKTITLTSKLSIKENENTVDVLSQELKKLDFTKDDYDENDKKFEQKYYNDTQYLSGALINLE